MQGIVRWGGGCGRAAASHIRDAAARRSAWATLVACAASASLVGCTLRCAQAGICTMRHDGAPVRWASGFMLPSVATLLMLAHKGPGQVT